MASDSEPFVSSLEAKPNNKSLLSRIKWVNLIALTITPAIGVYGAMTTPLMAKTLWWSVFLYAFAMLGVTAGYHRLYSHRSFIASTPLHIFLLAGGACAVQGSAFWWAREHRAHHRYTDTDLDPYSALNGFLYTHLGWIVLKRDHPPGPTDVRDLRKNKLVMFQHKNLPILIPIFGYAIPAIVPGYFWGDWAGGFFYAALFRLTVVQHSVFCINSLAHWFGDAPFDDKHTPRNHFFTAIVTMGEGYHNFHHQFPIDYRNAIKWYQYDPTKWFIRASAYLGLSTHLQTFPENEIKKGVLTMSLKKLKEEQDDIKWPIESKHLPVVDWETFQKQAETTPLILISGFIHDATGFEQKHPGGRTILMQHVGKDATAAFSGGVYDHSNAAFNLLAMMRVGVLEGGVEHIKFITPAERLRIIEQERAGGVEPLRPVVD
ncbi:hypothetical protein EIP91_002754 [Steccherinum ochraceum]|uniref:Acyl-CoA desaturase n=1 Tax=Steccherinum ochraceum TaxID=92696 RepID=A0A4R0RE20_9APHY|nr:hypothetical protein EIP91_002754 [Steccherinum ochraceum]